MPAALTIAPVSQALAHTETLAGWMLAEWLAAWGLGLREAQALVTRRCGPDPVPVLFVALAGPDPVGMVSLIEDDAPDGPGGILCLLGLYVVPGWRGQGFGSALCRHAVDAARALHLGAPALYTIGARGYFEALGWGPARRTKVPGPGGPQSAWFLPHCVEH